MNDSDQLSAVCTKKKLDKGLIRMIFVPEMETPVMEIQVDDTHSIVCSAFYRNPHRMNQLIFSN